MVGSTYHDGKYGKRTGLSVATLLISIAVINIQLCHGETSMSTTNGFHFNSHFEPTLSSSKTPSHPLDQLKSTTNGNARVLQSPEEHTAADKDFGGSDECPCMNSREILSTLSDCVITDTAAPGFAAPGGCYPLHYGMTCAAHEMSYDPLCLAGQEGNNSGGAIPSYCYDQWCYVDFNKCKSGGEFFYRAGFVDEDEADLFYSYTTCGSQADNWLTAATINSVDEVLQVVIPTFLYPSHFKYTEKGEIATDESYYYDDSIPWAGTVIDYLNAVVEISNINGVNFTSRSLGADEVFPASTYTAAVHDVSAGISDIGGSWFWITKERLLMTPYSTQFSVDRIHLFVKKPEKRSLTMLETAANIMLPFTVDLWLLLFVVVVITALMLLWLDRTEGERGIWNKKTSGQYWEKASTTQKMGIMLRELIDSFLIQSAYMLGHAARFDPTTSLAQKVVFLGFAIVIFIAVAAYTANLAAFVTLSVNVNYVASMEEAIATNTPVCVNSLLREEYEGRWPNAKFVYDTTSDTWDLDELKKMMAMYDAGECGAIGYSFEHSVLLNLEFQDEFCKRDLVSTGAYILEKPLAFPVRSKFAAGLSYWLHEAGQQSVTYQFFQEKRLPAPLCNLRIAEGSSQTGELQSMNLASMILPTFIWILSIIVTAIVFVFSLKKKRMKRFSQRGDTAHKSSSSPDEERQFRRVSYLSGPALRHRRHVEIHQSEDEELPDLLQQQHQEIMNKLSEIVSRNNRVKQK